MVELKVGVHLEARVKGFDGVPIAAVAVVEEADAVPQARVLREGGKGMARRRARIERDESNSDNILFGFRQAPGKEM